MTFMKFHCRATLPCPLTFPSGLSRVSSRTDLQIAHSGVLHVKSQRVAFPRNNHTCRAVSRDDDLEAFRHSLSEAENPSADAEAEQNEHDILTGEELSQLIKDKWGARYDCRLTRRSNGVGKLRFYLQVMWKYLEQKSFPLSEEEYYEQLDAVASLVTEWGLANYVRDEIRASKMAPVIGNTIGGGARCVSIPLIDADKVA
uniref:Uncharacterized protein n=1 Tax=Tetraselmis sp. GSL018 TaxID=582737 RepID=A0A061S4P9_9CHLO